MMRIYSIGGMYNSITDPHTKGSPHLFEANIRVKSTSVAEVLQVVHQKIEDQWMPYNSSLNSQFVDDSPNQLPFPTKANIITFPRQHPANLQKGKNKIPS